MTPTASATLDTPDGRFTVLVRDGVVLASGWTDRAGDLVALVHPTLRPGGDLVEVDVLDERVRDAADAVVAYYDGALTAPGAVPVHQVSGEFRMRAWDALRLVPAGERVTYAQYAQRAGSPLAVRAAAGACAMNAAALFVPCHRIVRSDGGIGGFRYGLPVKRSLLEREGTPAGTLL